MKNKVLLISFDAVSWEDTIALTHMPNFSKLVAQGCFVEAVDSVFISNTYPIHTSVVTGCHPATHGIIGNTKLQPENPDPDWFWYAKDIRVPTLYQAAYGQGLKTAAVMWPVTGGAGEIAYNIPEIFSNTKKSQLEVSLMAGSKALQMKEYFRHKQVLSGKNQPGVDEFAVRSLCDIAREHSPDFMLLHLTDYDSHKHLYGGKAVETMGALRRLDSYLGRVLEATAHMEHLQVVVFSDHGQLDVHTTVNPNLWLAKEGLLMLLPDFSIPSYHCYFDCCGGSAFFYERTVFSSQHIKRLKDKIQSMEGFDRYITKEEMEIAGRSDALFGIGAKTGFEFANRGDTDAANHGYTLDKDHYKVFYAAKGSQIKEGALCHGGSLLDVTALVAHLLGLTMPTMEGQLKEGILR